MLLRRGFGSRRLAAPGKAAGRTAACRPAFLRPSAQPSGTVSGRVGGSLACVQARCAPSRTEAAGGRAERQRRGVAPTASHPRFAGWLADPLDLERAHATMKERDATADAQIEQRMPQAPAQVRPGTRRADESSADTWPMTNRETAQDADHVPMGGEVHDDSSAKRAWTLRIRLTATSKP